MWRPRGLPPTEQKEIRLQVNEQLELNFNLRPASVSTSVEVNATEVAVEATNATLGQVITSEQVSALPLNGREFVQLATLTPGTTQETNPNSFFNGGPSSEVSARGTFSLSVGGSRAQSTDWLLDGNDDNELTAGGIGFSLRSTAFRNLRFSPTTTPPSSVRVRARPCWLRQSPAPTNCTVRCSNSSAIPNWMLLIGL